jgi:hypothetical protein
LSRSYSVVGAPCSGKTSRSRRRARWPPSRPPSTVSTTSTGSHRSWSGSGRATFPTASFPSNFELVGAALLWTLEQGLGELFTAEVREARTAAYAIITAAMLTGTEQANAALV